MCTRIDYHDNEAMALEQAVEKIFRKDRDCHLCNDCCSFLLHHSPVATVQRPAHNPCGPGIGIFHPPHKRRYRTLELTDTDHHTQRTCTWRFSRQSKWRSWATNWPRCLASRSLPCPSFLTLQAEMQSLLISHLYGRQCRSIILYSARALAQFN